MGVRISALSMWLSVGLFVCFLSFFFFSFSSKEIEHPLATGLVQCLLTVFFSLFYNASDAIPINHGASRYTATLIARCQYKHVT